MVSTIGIQFKNKCKDAENQREIAPQSLAYQEHCADQLPTYVKAGEPDLQLGH